MKDATDFAFGATTALFEAWWDAAAAITTIAARLPIVAADPTGREAHRMVAEKAAAAAQASLAAGYAFGRMALTPPNMAKPFAVASGLLKVAKAANRPVSKKVRANARRLTRAKSR